MSLLILAQEQIDKTTWYPTILGFLVVLAGIGLFCGSAYVLLGTNLGARLGFLVAYTGLMGFMVLLTVLWITTQSPLNTLKGSIPAWEVKEVVNDLPDAKIAAARNIERDGKEVDPVEAANVKAAVDDSLVTKVPTAVEEVPEGANDNSRFDEVTQYQTVKTFEVGGSDPEFLNFEFTHKPEYAVVQFCALQDQPVDFGRPPLPPKCDNSSDKNGFVVLERNLGSLRFPPVVAFIAFVLLFGLGLLALHWRERDEQEAEQRAAEQGGAAPAPVPAKV
jgi:hypothetical protein